jgi:hypothetical protein
MSLSVCADVETGSVVDAGDVVDAGSPMGRIEGGIVASGVLPPTATHLGAIRAGSPVRRRTLRDCRHRAVIASRGSARDDTLHIAGVPPCPWLAAVAE